MPVVTFVEADGTARMIDIAVGDSLMWGARSHDVTGIVAECGGCAACATCTVIVPAEWRARLPQPDIDETSMLDGEEANGRRLSCQVKVTAALDGLTVHVPASQY